MATASRDSVDFPTLLAALCRAADQGNAEAQLRLGMLYANGEGVDLNYVTAAEWFTRAAEQGQLEACRTLAWLYANGFGVAQDDAMARHWYLRAAEGGDPAAQCSVATMYQWGRMGVARDVERMLHWYEQAAARNYPVAQFALGKLMAQGQLVPRNDEAAFQWFTLAILNGSKVAQEEFAKLTSHLDQDTLCRFKQRMLARMQGG